MGNADAARLVVAVVDRGKGGLCAEVLRTGGAPFVYQCLGNGTANSRLLGYLGLSETAKDVVFAFAAAGRVRAAMAALDARLDLARPGRGVVFSCLLSGLSGQVNQALGAGQDAGTTNEEGAMGAANAYDLIVAVAERGSVDTVMEAARTCGARGGTVVHGKRVGIEDAGELFGASVEPEKDVVLIVAAHGQKLDIMRAISKAAGPQTAGRAVLFSVPVEDVMGLPVPPEETACDADA